MNDTVSLPGIDTEACVIDDAVMEVDLPAVMETLTISAKSDGPNLTPDMTFNEALLTLLFDILVSTMKLPPTMHVSEMQNRLEGDFPHAPARVRTIIISAVAAARIQIPPTSDGVSIPVNAFDNVVEDELTEWLNDQPPAPDEDFDMYEDLPDFEILLED